MADNKKKGFSLDKGKETKSDGFNISKGAKTTSSFGLDKGSKKVSSKKTVVSKKIDTKKSSVVKDSTKSSSSKDPQKTATQTTNSQNTKSNNSKLYALIGVAAILVVVFLIFSGDDKSTNPSSLSNEVVENSGSNLEGVSGENEMNNNNEMSVDNSNDSGNKSDDSSTVESSDVNTNEESNQSNSSIDNNNNNVVADSSDSSEDANNSIDTSNSESNSSVAENSTTTNSQSNNSKQVSFSNNDILYYFQFGSSYINPNDRVLNKLADELKSNNSKIKLVGHTDSTGSEAVNLEISKSRAQAVFNFLVSKGVNRNLISVDGLGESKPLNGNSNAEERSSNRRVEIILN